MEQQKKQSKGEVSLQGHTTSNMHVIIWSTDGTSWKWNAEIQGGFDFCYLFWFCFVVVVQLPSHVRLFWPHGLQYARPPCLSSSSQVCPSPCSCDFVYMMVIVESLGLPHCERQVWKLNFWVKEYEAANEMDKADQKSKEKKGNQGQWDKVRDRF